MIPAPIRRPATNPQVYDATTLLNCRCYDLLQKSYLMHLKQFQTSFSASDANALHALEADIAEAHGDHATIIQKLRAAALVEAGRGQFEMAYCILTGRTVVKET